MNPLTHVIAIIYPSRCPICGRFMSVDKGFRVLPHLCSSCLGELNPVTHPLCTICGILFPAVTGIDHLCEYCLRKRPWYNRARAPFLYSGLLMESIVRLKYNAETHLAFSLGALLSSSVKRWISKPGDFLIVPVPLHRRRLRQRGFNQSLLLSKALASSLGSGLDYFSLMRERDTPPQTGLGKDARRKNVRDAFSVTRPEAIKNKKIVLIDDVFTTGHTLNECARTLKKSGAASVTCLTLARTSAE